MPIVITKRTEHSIHGTKETVIRLLSGIAKSQNIKEMAMIMANIMASIMEKRDINKNSIKRKPLFVAVFYLLLISDNSNINYLTSDISYFIFVIALKIYFNFNAVSSLSATLSQLIILNRVSTKSPRLFLYLR